MKGIWAMYFFPEQETVQQTSKTGLQRPAARYDGIGKIGGRRWLWFLGFHGF